MKPYDLLIFDWDGTLTDSIGQITRAMQLAIAELGWEPRSDEAVGALVGLGLGDGLRKLYPGSGAKEVTALLGCFKQLWLSLGTGQAEAPLFAGAGQALENLHASGYTLAVATGKGRKGLERSLVWHSGIRDLFMTTRTADETANKPDPLMLREILAELELPAERALMIGDTEYDAEMAAAIGMPALGVASGVHSVERIREAGAMAVLETVAALPAWLAKHEERHTGEGRYPVPARFS